AGYKADRYTASTFQNVLISRVGNKDKSNPAELGNQSYVLASSRLYTDYTQGSMEDSGLPLDFAIDGEGFFAVEGSDGRAYTRAGNFALDNEGYLCLPGVGRVLDAGEQPIRLMTDKITADDRGNLTAEGGGFLGRLGVFTFADNAQLARNDQGLFTGGGQATAADTTVHWKMLEHSNVDLMGQMVEMLSSQRALQSAAQMTKMYDALMTKATTEVGRL
ncbi:MAG: flagellar hook-basal body complex protein, partial [Oscillospiraceae bacterium]